MRILHFYADSFKRLKVVDFEPDPNVVLVTGKNSQGKSSVLDAVFAALQYKAALKDKNPSPVRQGEDRAEVTLDLDDYTVTRTFDPDGGNRLRIETKEGNIVKSPQALLDRIVGSISFDPLLFANAKDTEKRKMLEEIFGINLAEFEATDSKLKESRKDYKRELEMIDGRLQAMLPPNHNDPASEVAAGDIARQITTLAKGQQEFDLAERQIKELDKQIEAAQATRAALIEKTLNLHAEHKLDKAVTRMVELQQSLQDIEKRNARAREVQEYMRLQEKRSETIGRLDTVNKKIALNEINRQESIEAADLPVKGLEITEDGVLFKNIPFDQLSSSERIKISMAIAMAANPELKVIRIADGSLLDDDNLEIIKEMARDKDFQVWIEIVSNNDKIGLVIEDGMIKE